MNEIKAEYIHLSFRSEMVKNNKTIYDKGNIGTRQ